MESKGNRQKNGVYMGSFNPVHYGHMETMRQALDFFDVLHVFVKYVEGVDLTDWETKRRWFERINAEEMDGRLRIYQEIPQIRDKQYGMDLFADFFRRAEEEIGEPIQGIVLGSDYDELVPKLRETFPQITFTVIRRGLSNGDYPTSSAIREDMEQYRRWLPDYVYQSLREVHARKEQN